MAAYDLRQAADQGISAATLMRNKTDTSWADSWKNFATQYALNEQANAHEVAMWNMQNEYNTPSAQMQRFKDAGLNPMLIYQQGNPGNASNAPGTHVPNAEIKTDADRLAKINGIMSIIGQFNQMIGQAFGVTEQAMDIGLKRNQLAWSNYDYSAASNLIPGFGHGRSASPGYRITETLGPNGEYVNSLLSSLDPSDPNFSPGEFRVLQRLGIAPYYPKGLTAEANAYLSGKRADYQQYYNEHLAPLIKDYYEGRNSVQELRRGMLQYESDMLNMLPPEYRAIIAPIFDYIRPFINSLLRR